MEIYWKKLPLKNFCEITSSKRIFAADYQPCGIPFYRGKEITEKHKGNLAVSTEIFISDSKFLEIKTKFGAPLPGDLLLTSVGTLGMPYVVKTGEEFYFKDGNLTWFRNFKGLDSRFLYYWLLSPQGRGELKKATIGSSQSAYTIVLLKEMEVALPPLETQRKIASILSAYDDMIENNTRRIKILEEMAQGIYREWFVHFRFPGHEQVKMVDSPLGRVPEGWEVTTLGEVCSLIKRGISPKYDESSESIVINQKCIRDLRLNLEMSRRHIKKVPTEKYVQIGDVLINSTGVGTLGRVAQVLQMLEDCTVDSHVTIVRADDSFADHHFFGLQLFELQSHFERSGQGATGQTELGREVVSDTPFLSAPKKLQQRFSEIVEPLRNLSVQLPKKNRILRQTRDLLLPKLISGLIDASELDIEEKEGAA